ncbi:MAG: ABC transporter permease [Kofleriaceae bacterium]
MTAERPFSIRARRRRVAALMRKEARQIVRDPSSLLIAFVLPLILLFVFGYGVSLDTSHTRVGLVVEAPSPTTRSLAAAFRASPYFDVQLATARQPMEAALARGDVGGIVIVPARFDAELRDRARTAEVQVIVNGADPNTGALVQGYARGLIANWWAGRIAEAGGRPPGTITEDRFWFNPARTSRYSLVPGSMALVMAMVGTLLTALVVAREWERGTMEALMATPAAAGELLLGKVVPYFVLGLISMTLCTFVAIVVFEIPFRGSFAALYALSAAFLLPSLGQGLLISAATKNQFLAAMLALLSSFLPAFLLSGFLFEIRSMPTIIRGVTLFVPARWLIPSLQSVFLAGDLWPMFLRAIAVMTVYGVVLLAVAVRVTTKRVA